MSTDGFSVVAYTGVVCLVILGIGKFGYGRDLFNGLRRKGNELEQRMSSLEKLVCDLHLRISELERLIPSGRIPNQLLSKCIFPSRGV